MCNYTNFIRKESVGITSARSIVTIEPSNAEKQRISPKYDWPMKMINVTNGVTRVLLNKLRKI